MKIKVEMNTFQTIITSREGIQTRFILINLQVKSDLTTQKNRTQLGIRRAINIQKAPNREQNNFQVHTKKNI